jgi:hypothetical protein
MKRCYVPKEFGPERQGMIDKAIDVPASDFEGLGR